MDKSAEKTLFALIAILLLAVTFFAGCETTEKHILNACESTGVYLNQNGLLVCEWRTPQKIR